MATANKNNIVKRIDVDRKLTFVEMDTNFEMLKLTIDDTAALEGQLANKVDTTVYNTKMNELDTSITALETSGVTEGRVNLIDDRVTANETDISTLQTNVSSNDTDIASLDSRISSNDTDIATLNTNVASNDTDISNLDTRVSSNEVAIANIDTRIDGNDTDIASLNTSVDEALVPSWTLISTSQTLQANTRYFVDFTNGPLTLTLPATPATYDFIKINKDNGNSENSIIARNGQTIMGLAENMTIDYNTISVNLIYNGTDWRISNE